jgi:replication factor C large subunit
MLRVNWFSSLEYTRTSDQSAEAEAEQAGADLWVSQLSPRNAEDFVGNAAAVRAVRAWFEGNGTAPLILVGPPGTGKTCLVHLTAEQTGFPLLVSGADEPRHRAALEGVFNNVGDRILLVDDADALDHEPTGLALLNKTVRGPPPPPFRIVVCVSDGGNAKLQGLLGAPGAVVVHLAPIAHAEAVPLLQRCAARMGTRIGYFEALEICRRSRGDVRRMINDMHASSFGAQRERIAVRPVRRRAQEATRAAHPIVYLDALRGAVTLASAPGAALETTIALADVELILAGAERRRLEDEEEVESVMDMELARCAVRAALHCMSRGTAARGTADMDGVEARALMHRPPPPKKRRKFDTNHTLT